jgi:hypothetical protein
VADGKWAGFLQADEQKDAGANQGEREAKKKDRINKEFVVEVKTLRFVFGPLALPLKKVVASKGLVLKSH